MRASAPAALFEEAAPLLIEALAEADAALPVEAGEPAFEMVDVEGEVALPAVAARSCGFSAKYWRVYMICCIAHGSAHDSNCAVCGERTSSEVSEARRRRSEGMDAPRATRPS